MRENGRRERPQNRTDAKPDLSDVYKNGTRAKRRQADVRLSGRSMVEMLGVLAIIGVLSVGAMSGYSKAMMKYKLNRQTEQISALINTIYMYQYEFHFETEDKASLIPIFQKLNAIPEGMKISYSSSGEAYLKDAFGTYNAVFINKKPYNGETLHVIYGQPRYESPITFTGHDIAISYCRNILSALQPVYKDNPDGFCYIYLRNQVGGGKYINLIKSQYNFANMTVAQITDIYEQQLTLTDKKQVYFQFCFRNTKS